jgi:replicative DNA helicase
MSAPSSKQAAAPNLSPNLAMEKGLPANIDAERFLLGSILLDDSRFLETAGTLGMEDFALEKHRRIYSRMLELHERGERVDRVTVANELMRFNELESVDGLGYLVSLDEGMPHIPNLEGYVRIIRDKSALRRIAMSAQHMMNRALIGEEDPATILASAEESFLNMGDTNRGDKGLMTPLEVIQSLEGGLNSFLDPSKRVKGISTGFTKFDEMTGGLHGGELVILAARPSMGKTAFALNIAWHVATKLFQPVAIFSLEMGRESLLTRMLCAATRVDSHRFRTGYLNQQERQKLRDGATQMVEAPIHIDDSAGVHLMDMHAKLRKMTQAGHKPGLVVIDYLQLMSIKGRSENRNQEVSQLSRGLKLLAKEMDCPFLVLSQLSRATETRVGDHRPQMSDLRESGSIEQDADLVGFIFREEVYKRDREDLRGLAELIVAKQRNGPIGTVPLVFLHAQTRFENRAEDLGDLPEG